ncbi:hypothetical protein C8P63_106118 [Melghirimyces profundicolus]|uniref:Uncharacterized protein n=1 Tax=Melghirimyces profundicolus TaxID=1242148 RepID=A0A2T6C0M0_9BACL|nr:hypothetical protein [Melghirimyces profundicolus]PTX61866.1 hypothetical protein C8P63_106118 [Melghirimyces profundicolus]
MTEEVIPPRHYFITMPSTTGSGETETLEKEIFSEALFSEETVPWESFVKRLLINELGEFGITCPLA